MQPAPTASAPTAPAFAPLPLRARGVLEILDIAVKVYKQYFWVLLGWSITAIACSALGTVVALVVPFGGTLPSVMLTPLFTGVVSCCIAAAVRGQRVEFRQCWQFTKPRLWPMVGYYILAVIVSGLVLGLITGAAAFFCFAGVWALSSAPRAVQVVTGIVGGVVLLTLVTMAATVVVSWHYLVPVVVCMEEDKQNSQALRRAYDLLRRQWVQVCTLMTLVSLGLIVLALILLAAWAILIGLPTIQRAFTGQHVEPSALWTMGVASVLTYLGIWIIAKPIFHLILVLFYFDVRVRQEALDLEWAAHVTAPPREAVLNVAAAALGEFHSFATPGYPAASPPLDPYGAASRPPPGALTEAATWAPSASVEVPETLLSPLELSPGYETVPATSATITDAPAAATTPQTSVGDSRACPQCGATAPASHMFCMRCGTRLKPPPTASPGGMTQW